MFLLREQFYKTVARQNPIQALEFASHIAASGRRPWIGATRSLGHRAPGSVVLFLAISCDVPVRIRLGSAGCDACQEASAKP
jgi:hypothetical protein